MRVIKLERITVASDTREKLNSENGFYDLDGSPSPIEGAYNQASLSKVKIAVSQTASRT
jgi:hypothetical protein